MQIPCAIIPLHCVYIERRWSGVEVYQNSVISQTKVL